MRSLHKVPMKAENIFTLKEARKNKHYNVIMLVDQSGSMVGERLQIAADICAFLARSLGKVDINYAVIGYSDGWRYHKKFNVVASDDFLKRMKYNMIHTGGGGTRVMPPIREAFKQLKKAPPDYRNIIIGLSDGSPDEDFSDIRKYVHGNAQIADYIDIGIGYKPVIESGFQVNTVQQVKPLLIKQLKQRIKRG